MLYVGLIKFSIFLILLDSIRAHNYDKDGHDPSRNIHNAEKSSKGIRPEEKSNEYWRKVGESILQKQLDKQLNTNVAKNVIFFIGDGLSVTTLAASRVYLGQKLGVQGGEELELSFEKFPVTGLAKTYCVDIQVADSACTATAYLGGIKTNGALIGLGPNATVSSCESMLDESNHVSSIAKWAIDAGKAAGIVTTTRVTHASPAAAYAYNANRYWENDEDMTSYHPQYNSTTCPDIAQQLVLRDPGKHFKVVLGGGRQNFLTKNQGGNRADGRNLIKEWKKGGRNRAYVTTQKQLKAVDFDRTDSLMGLFADSHLSYNLQADRNIEPSLTEMTEAAIRMLAKNTTGYFLFVEGGRIDHAHHAVFAALAMDETLEFHAAIERAVQLTSREDTLIVVSSDHSHVFTMSGYQERGHDILGAADLYPPEDGGAPYLTLSYANGPGYRHEEDGKRTDVTNEDEYISRNVEFRSPTMVDLGAETHGGEDVAVFALGPWQHLFSGVYEQNALPHIMAYASCIGDGKSACSSTANQD